MTRCPRLSPNESRTIGLGGYLAMVVALPVVVTGCGSSASDTTATGSNQTTSSRVVGVPPAEARAANPISRHNPTGHEQKPQDGAKPEASRLLSRLPPSCADRRQRPPEAAAHRVGAVVVIHYRFPLGQVDRRCPVQEVGVSVVHGKDGHAGRTRWVPYESPEGSTRLQAPASPGPLYLRISAKSVNERSGPARVIAFHTKGRSRTNSFRPIPDQEDKR